MRQAERSRIYAEASNANMFAAVQASSNCECRKALISPNGGIRRNPVAALPRREQYMWPSGQIYAEAVSQLKQAEFYGICGKRSAAEYTQKPAMQTCLQPCRPRATVSAARHLYLQMEGLDGIRLLLCRGVNSICGRQAKYTQKPYHNSSRRSFTVYAASETQPNIRKLLLKFCTSQIKACRSA